MVLQGWIDHRTAADMLGVSRQRLHWLQCIGRIGCVYLNGRRLYREEKVIELKAELERNKGPRG